MAPTLVISVFGESTINRVAERSIMKIGVFSTGKSQQSVSKDVTDTCKELHEIFVKLAPKDAGGLATADAPVTQFSMSKFSTNSYIIVDEDVKESEYDFMARTNFTAIFQDFAKLGEITSMLFQMPNVQVHGIEWSLIPTTIKSLGFESRKAAMQDAMRKASDYAEVLGRSLVAIEVKDEVLNQPYGTTCQLLQRSRGEVGKDQPDEMILEPEDVQIRTEIDVKFQTE